MIFRLTREEAAEIGEGAISQCYVAFETITPRIFLCQSEKGFPAANFLAVLRKSDDCEAVWTMAKLSDADMERFIDDGDIGDIMLGQEFVWKVTLREYGGKMRVEKVSPKDAPELIPVRGVSVRREEDEKRDLRRAAKGFAYCYTKDEIRDRLRAGDVPRDVLNIFEGYDGAEIFKADRFGAGDLVIYFPDISSEDLPPMGASIGESPEDIERVIARCYAGDDFIAICDGDVNMAERVFNACSWEHPETCYAEIFDKEATNDN